MTSEYGKLPDSLKRRWVKALRSGKYKKGLGMLYNKKEDRYCCLGVLGKIQKVNFRASAGSLRRGPKIPSCVSSQGAASDQLIFLNDDQEWSFKKIAQWIDKNL